MNRLPDKPSELLKVALTDLEICESDLGYVINMDSWYEDNGTQCSVCMAGAVMAKSLSLKMRRSLEPSLFGDGNRDKLLAINHFREGDVLSGLRRAGVHTHELEYIRFDSWRGDGLLGDINGVYNYDSAKFRDYVCMLIGVFESEGL